jgi:hypothetical protein
VNGSGNLQLNWEERRGNFNHSRHELSLTFAAEASIPGKLGAIYDGLKEFDHFNGGRNDVAVKSTRIINGVKYVFFDSLGIFSWLSDRINPREVPVRVWSRKSDRLVVGDTAGKHMLVGQRQWQAENSQGASILLTTESYDQPRGLLNRIGMRMMGLERQLRVWKSYFENIKDHYSSEADAADVEESSSPAPGGGSPWLPENPYPGVEMP